MKKYIKKIKRMNDSWCINSRYRIYDIDGCVYDTYAAKDIPNEVFKFRDDLENYFQSRLEFKNDNELNHRI